MHVLGLVTAAGKSTRMGGFPKPLLSFDGESFVERILGGMAAASVSDRVVVVGHEAEVVRERADFGSATVLTNGEYESGMLSSVRTGVRHAQREDADALILWPVDFPCSPASVVEALRDRYTEGDAEVVIPTYQGERGHPVLFGAETFEALLSAPDDRGARAVVYDDETTVADLPVADRRIHVDIDTPNEYWEAVKRYG